MSANWKKALIDGFGTTKSALAVAKSTVPNDRMNRLVASLVHSLIRMQPGASGPDARKRATQACKVAPSDEYEKLLKSATVGTTGAAKQKTVPTPAQKRQGLRCVIYDMLLLAASAARLKAASVGQPSQPSYVEGLHLSPDEVAFTTGLVKFRSLFDFLTGRPSEYDNMTISQFGVRKSDLGTMADFRGSMSHYFAHLDWERVKKAKKKQPQWHELLAHTPLLLQRANEFVLAAEQKGIVRRGRAETYYLRFLDACEALYALSQSANATVESSSSSSED